MAAKAPNNPPAHQVLHPPLRPTAPIGVSADDAFAKEAGVEAAGLAGAGQRRGCIQCKTVLRGSPRRPGEQGVFHLPQQHCVECKGWVHHQCEADHVRWHNEKERAQHEQRNAG